MSVDTRANSVKLPKARLDVNELQLAEHRVRKFSCRAAAGVAFTQVLDPGYWAHVGEKLKRQDQIEIRAEDGKWWAWLIVEDCGRAFARVQVLLQKDLQVAPPKGMSLPEGYHLKWTGDIKQWVVIFEGRTIRDGFASESAAFTFASNHAQSVESGTTTMGLEKKKTG